MMSDMRHCLSYIILLSALGWSGCINTPADAEECYWVEQQRCELRGRCYSDFDVEGCQYYYKEQCRARNIVPDYSEDELNACLTQIRSFGKDNTECNMLQTAEKSKKLELCTLDALDACRPLACEEYYSEDEDTSDEDTEDSTTTDTGLSDGLNP